MAAGVIGAAVGYIVGKNFGSKISNEVKKVAENPEDLKENIEKLRENSGEILEEVRGKVTDMLGQLDEKLKVVDAIIGKAAFFAPEQFIFPESLLPPFIRSFSILNCPSFQT